MDQEVSNTIQTLQDAVSAGSVHVLYSVGVSVRLTAHTLDERELFPVMRGACPLNRSVVV